jgi:hypothetical protein
MTRSSDRWCAHPGARRAAAAAFVLSAAIRADVASAQLPGIDVPALVQSMGVPLDQRGLEGAFDDGLRPGVPVQPSVFNTLATLMVSLEPRQRRDAAYAFGVLAGPGAAMTAPGDVAMAASALVQMMTTPDWRTRVAGARVSGRVFTVPFAASTMPARPKGLPDALFLMLNSNEDIDRLAAMDALGRMRETAAVTALTERYGYHRGRGERPLAGGALEALARIGHSSSVPLVSALGADPWFNRDDPTGLAAAFARERLLQDGSIARIRQALDKRDLKAQAQAYLDELRR